MSHRYHDIAFTAAVKAHQEDLGSRSHYAKYEDGPQHGARLGPDEAAFIAEQDSFYMASVSETGWPYIQHRGGPKGFMRVVDETTLGFADFSGNRQYITIGNARHDARVALFFMDYGRKARLKLFGTLEAVAEDDATLLERLVVPDYRARVERGLLIRVAACEWNCPQHITQRYRRDEVEAAVASLHARIAALEAQLENYS